MGLLDDFTEEEIAEEEEKEEFVPKEKKEEEEEKELGIKLVCEDNKRTVTTENKTDYLVKLVNETNSGQKIDLKGHLIYTTDRDEWIPWEVTILNQKTLSNPEDEFSTTVEVDERGEKRIPVGVNPPEDAGYGDKVEIIIDASSAEDVLLSDSITLITTARPTVVAVKTQINQEKNVADYISKWAKKGNKGVFSILSPKPVRGYIFLEAMNPHRVEDAISGTRKAKSVVEGETSIEEVEHFLTPKLAVEGIAEGDIVELSAGPFKGENARVTKINEDNDEITVELFEATVPIPVTVRGDHVRVLEKDEE